MSLSMVRLPPMPTIKEVLQIYSLRAQKRLSQNFLLNSRLTDKIVKAAGNIEDGLVLEVGPGPGNITRSILSKNPRKVIVIEKDTRFQPMLEQLNEASSGRLDIIWGDVMSLNMEKLFPAESACCWEEHSPNIYIIGNLPFNVSTHLIIRWLQAISERRSAWAYGRVRLTLTFQKEVAERMNAPVLSSNRCRLSLMCQNYCYVKHPFSINGSAFVPKPDVDVGVVSLIPRKVPVIQLPFKLVEKVIRCTFHFRRKYCIKGVGALYPPNVREELSRETLLLADVDSTTRPYALTLEEMNRICLAYHEICSKYPKISEYGFSEPSLPNEYWNDALDLVNHV